MSCPRCGGMSAADLAAAMDELVCGWAVIDGPYCHCDEIESSMQAGSLGERNDGAVERPNRSTPSERRRP
ncbi:MAG: hypothetical protein P0119_20795 [Nitrospira sp.]|nr:hypothetical protein [Nitrospira sp.]